MIERTFITIGPTHYVEEYKYAAPGGFPPRARHRAAVRAGAAVHVIGAGVALLADQRVARTADAAHQEARQQIVRTVPQVESIANLLAAFR